MEWVDYTVIDPPLGQSLPVVCKLCAHQKSESAFPSVCGSKQVTIGFHLLILGWKDTELGDLFPIVQLTGLSEWWVDDSNVGTYWLSISYNVELVSQWQGKTD